jgi:hypothetical protein
LPKKLLIGIYLSFFDKKDLTNGIDWFIPCAMNANEISPKAGSRMKRIQKFSVILRTFFFTIAVLSAIGGLSEFFWGLWGLKLLHAHVYRPNDRVAFEALNGVMNMAWSVALWFTYKLFALYAQGDLFSSRIVHCLQRIGCVGIVIGIFTCVSSIIHAANVHPSSLDWAALIPIFAIQLMELFFNVIPGFAIILIAWVMDEGRKIQEEQELTV